jgi:predicted DNA-binding transcriptional regulator AlpA
MKLVTPSRLPEYGLDISDMHRKRLEARGEFPKRVQVTERKYAYSEKEILAHTASLIAERDRKAS